MPNIIEQQDLLKGLPDTRLMTLLQNPVGDIPPFLVAAEAQRRQQIRQQFAGSGSKESVVDTLTKQLANVPQNVNAPARTPPTIPQTPQMQGVMALQQQQAMTDIAQQAQPQTMRSGGMVQRYQSQGLVQRMGELYGSRSPTVQQLSSMTPEELAALRKYQSDEKMRRLNERAQITGGRYGQGLAHQRELLENRFLGPFADFYSPESTVEAAKKLQDLPSEEEMNRTLDTGEPLPSTANNRIFPTIPAGASGGMSLTTPPKAPARPAETPPPEPGETPDEYRARLEKILAAQEPSDWEKAQGYFAMAEQFLDPSKTTMQSLVGAGQAFSQSAGEQARAQREAKLALERGLLEYDMEKAQSREEAEQNASKNRVESFKYQADQALREADLYRKAADDAKSELNDYIKSLDMAPEANDPRVVELRKRIQDANGKLNEAVRRSQYYNYQYGKTFGTYGTPTFWDPANPDVLSQ
jgi:hypothetical protein